jgi:glutathione S-transferase
VLRLLGRKTSANVQKVLWCLDELKIPFTREDFGGEFGGNRTPEFLKLNPNGVVPTLIDGEAVIWESNTILRYIANRFGPTLLYPLDPVLRADCERWMDWQLGTLNLCMTPLYVSLIRTPPERRDRTALEENSGRASALFLLLDTALQDRRFIAGDTLTLADIALGAFGYRWVHLDENRAALMPHLKTWMNRLADRPAFRKHVAIGLA